MFLLQETGKNMKDKVKHTMGGTAGWSDIIWASVYSGGSHEGERELMMIQD